MLIDTQQIISKTELRDNFNRLLAAASKGNEMLITDRGKPIVRVIPAFNKKLDRVKILREMDRIADGLKDCSSDVPAAVFIREMRDSRK